MSMSKKDFIALADCIRAHQYRAQQEQASPIHDDVLETLANFCFTRNHAFKRDRWLGYIAGKNGPCGGKINGS